MGALGTGGFVRNRDRGSRPFDVGGHEARLDADGVNSVFALEALGCCEQVTHRAGLHRAPVIRAKQRRRLGEHALRLGLAGGDPIE